MITREIRCYFKLLAITKIVLLLFFKDKSFTCTLFLPFDQFDVLKTKVWYCYFYFSIIVSLSCLVSWVLCLVNFIGWILLYSPLNLKFFFPLHPMDILLNLFLPVVGLHTENYVPLFSFHVSLWPKWEVYRP